MIPITGVILVILVLVAASYRQVVMTYPRAGGSYIVARENFGPRVAQVAAAALLIDYVVTVAVQAGMSQEQIDSLYRALKPDEQDQLRYRVVSPSHVKEALAGAAEPARAAVDAVRRRGRPAAEPRGAATF